MTELLFLVDSDTLIDVEHRRPAAVAFLLGLGAGPSVGVSVVSIAEYYSGAKPGARPAMDLLIASLRAIPVTEEIALAAAEYRREFRSAGTQLHIPDCLIAATAKLLDATLVTRNLRDFPMADIRVVSPEPRA